MTVTTIAFVQTEANGKTRPYDMHDVSQSMTRIVHRRQGVAVTDALTMAQDCGRPQTNALQSLAVRMANRAISRLRFAPPDYLGHLYGRSSIHRKFAFNAATSQGQRAI
jgi:hypothetical protein